VFNELAAQIRQYFSVTVLLMRGIFFLIILLLLRLQPVSSTELPNLNLRYSAVFLIFRARVSAVLLISLCPVDIFALFFVFYSAYLSQINLI